MTAFVFHLHVILFLINSPSNVTLRRNDLLNGKDAVSILDNNGNVCCTLQSYSR